MSIRAGPQNELIFLPYFPMSTDHFFKSNPPCQNQLFLRQTFFLAFYVELQDQWNCPYFFLKVISHPLVNETAPIFFSGGVFPSYFHVISDFCHIWGPFMAKIEKMCQKSAFLVVPGQNH